MGASEDPPACPEADRDRIAGFYDQFNKRLIKDYLIGNPRIEEAIALGVENMPEGCRRVLDIGCGLGWSTHEFAHARPGVQAVGVDISPENIRLAQQLFASGQTKFLVSNLQDDVVQGEFDLITMIDVHEHIPRTEWADCHRRFSEWLSSEGSLVMTLPSPEHQRRLAEEEPEGLQVIDETVTYADIGEMAQAMGMTVASFGYVSVWKRSDYMHVVLRRNMRYGSAPRDSRLLSRARRAAGRVRQAVRRRARRAHATRKLGAEAVRQSLG